jgi:cell division protein FtsI/penicillin-binding protein 2
MTSLTQTQHDIFNRRLPVVIVGMIALSGVLLLKLISFQQLAPEVIKELRPDYNRIINLASARGIIYDREGQPLAVNTVEYRVGISPNLVSNPQRTATQLASILNMDELDVYQKVTSREVYEVLKSPVSADVGQQLDQLRREGMISLVIEKIPRRSYPQGTLASQVLGFVNRDLKGYYGVEGRYQDQLSGRSRSEIISDIPFELPPAQEADHGSDLYLTIDRDIQYLLETELTLAIQETNAKGGTIIVMNPRTGDILGMASWPSFDPNAYQDVADPSALTNPAISSEYEPGSVMKVVTVAAALQSGTITPQWTYNDTGIIDQAGVQIFNWDRQPHGVVDTTGVLVNSLNVGAATISLSMGPTKFYEYMSKFGFGRLTGVNLQGEATGTMHVPGDSDWSESNLLTNSYGQGIAATPLQMITAVSAIANDGLVMQPNIVKQVVTDGQISEAQPIALFRPISEEVAHQVRDMMVAVVQNGLDGKASLPGYTVAGKTGTAEIPIPTGYKKDAFIMSFIGFLPADDPQVIVLYKLDEPKTGNFASQVVAPLFRRLGERLVVLMEIPSDDMRRALEAQGGAVNLIQR